ncbi:carbonic anhydrase-related protein 10-like isoform X2 [Artemia franciscana]|uniref:carbonic anhydrase-related protein 10-like isoform X2 n=1 Tax=Artemia franciscana TaxID=6661 RepID=UPI0032DBD751
MQCITIIIFVLRTAYASWDVWWTYDGISGASFWNVNPMWKICSEGKQQSPIDIIPKNLLFDPALKSLYIGKQTVSGSLRNTGQTLLFQPSKSHSSISGTGHHPGSPGANKGFLSRQSSLSFPMSGGMNARNLDQTTPPVNITGGPLAYSYQIEEVTIHFGTDNDHGSEHKIDGNVFPAEIGEVTNPELQTFTGALSQIPYAGMSADVSVSLRGLLPSTDHFVTYEGSTTHPGCWETVTWIVFNRPIYITKQELSSLRSLNSGNATNPKGAIAGNIRPLQRLNSRTVRTNIDFHSAKEKGCPTMKYETSYKATRSSFP